MNSQALLPRVAVTSTPFATKAAVAESVPDGSATTEKPSPHVPFTRAPFATGVRSGLPAGSRLVVSIIGEPTQPEVWLEAPFAVDHEAIEQVITGSNQTPIVVKIPGRL